LSDAPRVKEAGLELTAKAPVTQIDLANLDTGLSVSSHRGDVIWFIAEEGLSPLHRLSKVNSSWIGKLLGQPVTFGGASTEEPDAPPSPEEVFEEVAPT
jgi:hypothetical protein